MNRSAPSGRPARSCVSRVRAFTLVEILISILILALGVLGLGVLFPVIIREQRLGTDATAGVSVGNSARTMLTQVNWAGGLRNTAGVHPELSFDDSSEMRFIWAVMRDPNLLSSVTPHPQIVKGLGKGWQDGSGTNYQYYARGEWYTTVVDLTTGALQLGVPLVGDTRLQLPIQSGPNVNVSGTMVNGYCEVPIGARLYPSNGEPQFVWDVAFQRVSNFEHTHSPLRDPIRAAVFVRRLDPRVRATGSAASVRDAITNGSGSVSNADARFPVGEDSLTGDPTLDGTGVYSAIKTCEIEFFYDALQPGVRTLRDRLYQPQQWTYGAPPNLARVWAQMRQPGQKLVDNLGNIYTVIGSGAEPTLMNREYLRVDPPVPENVTSRRASPAAAGETTAYGSGNYIRRAISQVAFTPQIPMSVSLVEVARGSPQ